jgi:hypothetical protein
VGRPRLQLRQQLLNRHTTEIVHLSTPISAPGRPPVR